MDFKNIHVGCFIKQKLAESNIEIDSVCKFFECSEGELQKMYELRSIDMELLLGWSKLLQYDFFRIYSHHLILYAPPQDSNPKKTPIKKEKTTHYEFRKNIYTVEIIDYILEMISRGEKTRLQIINEYGIPKTTLYKWIEKYKYQYQWTNIKEGYNDVAVNRKTSPDYKLILLDILKKKYPHKEEACKPILERETLSVLDIIKLNRRIFEDETNNLKINQKHRSYDESTILEILDYQKRHGSNNSQVATHFSLSRNTIAKWRRIFL